MDAETAINVAIGIIGLISAVAGLVGTVWVFFRKRIRRWWRPYKEGIAGMADLPSVKDEVTESRQDIHCLRKEVGFVSLQMRARADINIEHGEFECDDTGALVYASRTLARWLGVGAEELKGWRWVSFISPEDRDHVRTEWDLCRAEHRVFSQRYTIIGVSGERIEVDTIITPVPEDRPARQWIGVTRRVES